jgi:microcystin degradation protein MlrC
MVVIGYEAAFLVGKRRITVETRGRQKTQPVRIAVGQLLQESNSFNPILTTIDDFCVTDALPGDSEKAEPIGFMDEFSRHNSSAEFFPLRFATAVSGGSLTSDARRVLLDSFESTVEQALPVDAVFLSLHGALVAEDEEDVEGVLLERVRRIVGATVPIAVSFDMHALVTKAKLDHPDIVVGYRTMPHCDMRETGARAAGLLHRMLRGDLDPAIHCRFLPLMVPPEKQHNRRPPLAGLYQLLNNFERAGTIEDGAIFLTQPWLDVAEFHSAVLTMAQAGSSDAARVTDSACDALWAARHDFMDRELTPVTRIVEQAIRASDGPIVVSDAADATTSGSPGDSTILLGELLRQEFGETALLTFTDPEAVRAALQTGVGEEMTVDLGGKRAPGCSPISLCVRVKSVDDCWDPERKRAGPLDRRGKTVLLEHESLRFVVTEGAVSGHHPDVYRDVGLEPAEAKLVQVKSPTGFRFHYEDMAKDIFVMDGRGASDSNFSRLPFRKRRNPLYPFDDVKDWKHT